MEQPQKKRGFWGAISLFARTPQSAAELEDGTGRTAQRTSAQEPESPAKRASESQLQNRKILGRPQGPSSRLAQTLNASDFIKISDIPPNPTGTFAVPDDDSNASSPVVERKKLGDAGSRSSEFRMPGDMPGKAYSRKADLHWKSKSMYERTSNLAPGSTPYKAASRMPGDNPYKTIGPGSSRLIAPAFPSRHSVYGSSTLPTNVFRESMKRPSISSFAPKLPANTLKQSFPPNTPGKPPRGATAELNGRAMRQDDAVELFDMQIPNPPEDLSGEALSKQVPEDKARVGSIYADEFLAHYCPDDFDGLQRRQFFCILDLRRLKYAADEIFVKKDWKLNVLNFAKEYEKSRSLIMLRYGLYEFKTIRASEAVTKEWKQKHGIADAEEESQAVVVSKPNNVGSKRKAEDDLAAAKDTALTTSSTNLNKRARPESAPQTKVSDSNKNKRKASVGEPDENQPSKVQKATSPAKTSSLTRSIFESVANSPSAADKSAPKKSLMASATTKTPNGTARSVFDSPAKPITHNIFGQLSDTSKGSGNEADSDSDAEEDAEDAEPESEQQSDEPSVVASGGIGTPQFGGLLPKTNGASSASSEAGESTKGRSLFDRVTRDPEGQPVRSQSEAPTQDLLPGSGPATPPKDEDGNATPAPVAAVPPSIAPTPGNNTWNTGTPIKFAASTNPAASTTPGPSIFASSTVPAASTTPGPSIFASSTVPAASTTPGAPLFGQKPTSTPSFSFGAAPAKKADEASVDDPKPAPAQSAKSLFGAAAAKPESASSFFGSAAKPAASAPVQFGSSAALGPSTAADKTTEPAEKTVSSTPAPAAPFFGAKPAAPSFGGSSAQSAFASPLPGSDAAKPAVFQSSTLFGSAPKADSAAAPGPAGEKAKQEAAQSTSLLGKRANEAAEPQTPAASLFGAPKPTGPSATSFFGAGASTPGGNLFGTPATPAPKKEAGEEPPAKRAFGQGTPGSLFGASAAPAPSFGAPSSGAPTFSFGAGSKSQERTDAVMASPDAGKKTAGAGIGGASGSAQFSFGSSTPATASFGGSQNPVSTPFGGASQQTATQPASQSFTAPSSGFSFTAGGGGVNNPFSSGGTTSAPQSFNFGASTNANSSAPSSFTFGSTTAPSFSFGGDPKPAGGDSSSSLFAFGGNASGPATSAATTTPAPSTGGGGMFAFGGAQNGGTGSMFGQHLAPGGGTSTGTNSPFTFGGASSLATTPATGTPEPGTENEDAQKKPTDGDDEPQAQISLTDGGPGEEDESVVHEVRAKALKLVTKSDKVDDDDDEDKDKDNKNPWKVRGVGPLRLLRHKTTGAVRILLRAEPRGSVAMNKALLPNFTYKPEANGGKYVKITTSDDSGTGLETWMVQVKTPALAKALADVLEANKDGGKKQQAD